MSTAEAILITVVAFFLAAIVCLLFFGNNVDNPLLVPVFLVAWFLIGYVLAETSNRKRKR